MRHLLALIVLAGCAGAPPNPDVTVRPSVAVAMGLASVTTTEDASDSSCDKCGGSGWWGDGNPWRQCDECNADGKKPRPSSDETSSASQRSEVARPVVPEGPPVETPLVATVLPRKDAPQPPTHDHRWNADRGVWVTANGYWEAAPGEKWAPVKQPGPNWRQVGHHAATVEHLVNEHGIDRATAERLTPSERDVVHSNAHNAASPLPAPVRTYSSGCPGGNCGNQKMRGVFGRWR